MQCACHYLCHCEQRERRVRQFNPPAAQRAAQQAARSVRVVNTEEPPVSKNQVRGRFTVHSVVCCMLRLHVV